MSAARPRDGMDTTMSQANSIDAAPPPDALLVAVLALVADDGVKVPPIPGVVARLTEQLSNPSSETRDVTRLVGTDQALAAHILRCASNTLLASRGQITSLNDAVMRVGTNGLFSLVVAFSIGRETARQTPLQSLRRDVFRRAAATAEFCRCMAPGRGLDPEGAFLCGLLGSFGLTVAFGAIEQVLASKSIKESRAPEAWMDMAIRCEAAFVANVAAKWGMPALVSDVIQARRSGEGDARLRGHVDLLVSAEALTELFFRVAAPEEEQIRQAIGCSPAQAAEIAAFLPQIAASVLALGAATDDLKLTQSMQIMLIDAPQTTLKGVVIPTSIPVTVERRTGDQQLVCVGLASDGFVATGTQSLPVNQIVKCRLLGIDEDLELVAFVAAVSRDGDYRFEVKPVGLSGPTARSWQKLREAAGAPVAAVEPPRPTHSISAPGGKPHDAVGAGGTSTRSSPFSRLGGWLRRGS
jgi:HD-like signal output (HDOD) protein